MWLQLVFVLLVAKAIIGLEDAKFWHNSATAALKESLAYKWNTNKAKNVIIFIGDGMSIDTITATRIYHRGETESLAWERLPHVGLIKTYNVNKQVPDSASTATALFTGVKTNFKVIGVDSHVKLGDCEASLNENYHLQSIIQWAQAAGKATGFVTTTRVTHATPAPLYAHCPDRMWECESTIPESSRKCRDIARQLIEDLPGRDIRVIMGGGRQCLKSNVTAREFDPLDTWACYSTDGRDLMADWAKDKKSRKQRYKIIENNEQLADVNPDNVDFLLGIFANGHISMDWSRNDGPKGQPSLEDMTKMAIKVLRKSNDGFLLVVEGGLIDFAHHRGKAAQALRETARLSDAINATLEMVNTEETLVIVTSDHSHSMMINGYPDRGSSILGFAEKSKFDGTPFTTLTYSTGGPNNMGYEVKDGKLTRIDPSKVDTTDYNYSQQSAIVTNEALHGGGDVPIYAIGPHAHLFHSTHEQNYVAHVIAYAAKIGPHSTNESSSIFNTKSLILMTTSAIIASVLFTR